jgi:hypothetical protein
MANFFCVKEATTQRDMINEVIRASEPGKNVSQWLFVSIPFKDRLSRGSLRVCNESLRMHEILRSLVFKKDNLIFLPENNQTN